VTVHDAALVGPTVGGLAAGGGTTLVIVETDRSANVAVHDALHAAVAAAL
jgi:hypothetical protein